MAVFIKDQPAPEKRAKEYPTVLHVIQDLTERAKMGYERYGTLLTTNNGRDQLVDAYQEALDLVLYLRAEIEKRSQKETEKRASYYMNLLNAVDGPPREPVNPNCQTNLERLWTEPGNE